MAFSWNLGLFSSSKLVSASPRMQDEETFLAPARLLLALVGLATICVDPTYHGMLRRSLPLLLLYLLHSILVLEVPWYRREWISSSRASLHIIDVLCTACIPLFIGVERPYLYYVFFLFVLMGAAYRWGLYETLVTAAACISMFFIVALLSLHGGWLYVHWAQKNLDWRYFTRRAGYFLLFGYIVGFVGQKQVESRLADASIARLIGKVHSQTSVRDAMGTALGTVLEIFGTNDVALVVKEEQSNRAFLWQAEITPGSPKGTLRWEELETFQHQKYFFPLPGTPVLYDLGEPRGSHGRV